MQKSSGWISAKHFYDSDTEEDRIIEANADIESASDFNVGIEILGVLGFHIHPYLESRFSKRIIKRSFGILCGTSGRTQSERTIEYGKRMNGDFLVQSERYKVEHNFSADRNQSRFPSQWFDFSDGAININYASLTIDVSTV